MLLCAFMKDAPTTQQVDVLLFQCFVSSQSGACIEPGSLSNPMQIANLKRESRIIVNVDILLCKCSAAVLRTIL